MAVALGIVVLVVVIGLWVAYGNWLKQGIRMRRFTTSIPADQVRAMFEERVGRAGWKIVDDGNPMVAQSSLVTGIRQQISLRTVERDSETQVVVGAARWVSKYGVPKKAHTIRLRLNSFVDAVQAKDPKVVVTVGGAA